MENIVIEAPQQEFTDFMAMPPGLYKNIVYKKNIMGRTFWESNLCKKDDVLYYSYNTFCVKRGSNNGFYTQRKTKKGFTFEKNKLSIWFASKIGRAHV